MPISSIADAMRKTSLVSPMANPIVATKSPMAAKESATPVARAIGAKRCSLAAVPNTMGKMGSTQGDMTDSAPATRARPSMPKLMAGA